MERVTLKKLAAVQPQAIASILGGPPARAAAWVEAAAKNGIVEAQAVYGQYLLSGHGVERDPVAALVWFKHAANADHPMAMNMVGRCYELGWGTAPCPEVSTYWYRLAAQAQLDWGMYNYGSALALGRGVEQDRAQALEWFRRAAELGHVKSMNFIGSFYEDGWEVEVDLDAAFEYYRLAACGGDFRGQYNYARLLAGKGRLEEAKHWLRQVPLTATQPFLQKAVRYFEGLPHASLRALAQALVKPARDVRRGGEGMPV